MNQTPEPEPSPTDPNQSAEAPQAPPVAQNLPPDQMARFVTSIKNPELQVGEHVVRALQHADTVAVLTTVVVGPTGAQHLVSAALNAEKVAQVNALIQGAAEEREEEVMCVGFHCLIDPKKRDQGADTES